MECLRGQDMQLGSVIAPVQAYMRHPIYVTCARLLALCLVVNVAALRVPQRTFVAPCETESAIFVQVGDVNPPAQHDH